LLNLKIHPDSNIDLAVFPLDSLQKECSVLHVNPNIYVLPSNILCTKEEAEKLTSIEDVIMIGYPNGQIDSENNQPIVRKGITATSPKIPFEKKKEFLIDISLFRGSSGSPVFVYEIGGPQENSRRFGWKLIGINKASWFINSSSGKVENSGQIPTNLGLILNADLLLEFK
jgi:hypothetical protein